jgi:segregation and condensation protein A
VADALAERQTAGLRTLPRMVRVRPSGEVGLDDVTLDVLRRLMLDALRRRPHDLPPASLPFDPTVTLAERVGELRLSLARGERLSFRRLVAACITRGDMVITFLAVLELLKAGECDARQQGHWQDIEIVALVPNIP